MIELLAKRHSAGLPDLKLVLLPYSSVFITKWILSISKVLHFVRWLYVLKVAHAAYIVHYIIM